MPIFACHLKKIIIITSPKCGSTSLKEYFMNIENYDSEMLLKLLHEYKIYIVFNENIIKRFLSGFFEDLINNSCYNEIDISFKDYVDILYNININKVAEVNKIQYNNIEYNIWWGECSNRKISLTDEHGEFMSHIQSQTYSIINFLNILDNNCNVEIIDLKNLYYLIRGEHKNKSEAKHDFPIKIIDMTNISLKDIKKNVFISTQNTFDSQIEKKIMEIYKKDIECIKFLKLKFKHITNINALIGYTGFVGSNLLKNINCHFLYNSKNIETIQNKNFETIYFCGLPAQKWLINKNPEKDIKNIELIINLLKTVNAKRIILISTIDVYENTDGEYDENHECTFKNNNYYGEHRYMFENFIKTQFKNYHIVRLPALFGDGLKKNILYDLLNNNQIKNISTNTYFQWYNLDNIFYDIKRCIDNDIKIINLFSEPVETKQILNLFKYEYIDNPTTYFKYDVKSIYGYNKNKETILEEIKNFIAKYKKINFQLSVSNICVNNGNFKCLYNLLKFYGITNIEIAPTKYMSWDIFDDNKIKELQKELNEYNLKISSFQSITFNTQNLNIFNTFSHLDFIMHLKKIAEVANSNNIRRVVFGCPKNRLLPSFGNFYFFDNFAYYNIHENIAIHFFKIVGDIFKLNNVILCIENNSKKYGCNFLNTIKEVGNFVKKVNHENIKMMVDVGNCMMENDNLDDCYKYFELIEHVHMSCENMNFFETISEYHLKMIEILKNINYHNIVTFEFLNNENNIFKLNETLKNFSNLI
jgi:sugar phosphate isomerase/epimerase